MEQAHDIILDGDHVGHVFRGNQHVSQDAHSRLAVHSSMRAKHSEVKGGDAKAQKKSHKSAYHAHSAALEQATTKTSIKYHKTMAKFHGSRAGLTLDAVGDVDEVLDKVGIDSKLSIVGRIYKDGTAVGAATIAGDGKAMVYVKGLGGERVSAPEGRAANRADDPASMIKWLLAGHAPVIPDVAGLDLGNASTLSLKEIVDGAHDAVTTSTLELGTMLRSIESSINDLMQLNGELSKDEDELAQKAITHWAELDEKVNG